VGTSGSLLSTLSGWLFFYLWASLYYVLSFVFGVYCKLKLRQREKLKGIDGLGNSYRARNRRIEEANTINATFTAFFAFLGVLYAVTISVDSQVLTVIFCFLLGARGVADGLVWFFLEMRDARKRRLAARLEAVLESEEPGDLPETQPLTERSHTVSGQIARALSDAAREAAPSIANVSATQLSSTLSDKRRDLYGEDSVELNSALKTEVLWFTLLGLRASAKLAHKSRTELRVECADVRVNMINASRDDTEISADASRSDEKKLQLEEMLRFWNFEFTSHHTTAFDELRADVFGVTVFEYLREMQVPDTGSQFDGGKSGAIMFMSKDQRFIVKQLSSEDFRCLDGLIGPYTAHMKAHGHSLLMRIVQCCTLRMYSHTLHFMVIENIFNAARHQNLDIRDIYDLKASSVNRHAEAKPFGSIQKCRLCGGHYEIGSKRASCAKSANGHHRPSATLKDLDLIDKVCLSHDYGALHGVRC
jgi:hypothetical protein